MNAVARLAEPAVADTFAARLALLLSGGRLEVRGVDANGLALLDNTRLPKSADGLLFESPVQLAAPVISNRKTVYIGAQSCMNDGGYLRGPVAAGRYCSIGRRVSIGAGEHAMAGLSTSPFFASKPREAQHVSPTREPRASWTILMHDVWVGDGAVILPGVSIVAGAPARPIGMRFPACIISRVLAAQYWELPPLKTLPAGKVLDFLEAVESRRAANGGAAEFPVYKLCAEPPT